MTIPFERKALSVNEGQTGRQALATLFGSLLLHGGFIGVTNWFSARIQSFFCKENELDNFKFSAWRNDAWQRRVALLAFGASGPDTGTHEWE